MIPASVRPLPTPAPSPIRKPAFSPLGSPLNIFPFFLLLHHTTCAARNLDAILCTLCCIADREDIPNGSFSGNPFTNEGLLSTILLAPSPGCLDIIRGGESVFLSFNKLCGKFEILLPDAAEMFGTTCCNCPLGSLITDGLEADRWMTLAAVLHNLQYTSYLTNKPQLRSCFAAQTVGTVWSPQAWVCHFVLLAALRHWRTQADPGHLREEPGCLRMSAILKPSLSVPEINAELEARRRGTIDERLSTSSVVLTPKPTPEKDEKTDDAGKEENQEKDNVVNAEGDASKPDPSCRKALTEKLTKEDEKPAESPRPGSRRRRRRKKQVANNSEPTNSNSPAGPAKPKAPRKKKAETQGMKNTLVDTRVTDYFAVRRSDRKCKTEIEVVEFDNKGRGVVASKAFKRGDFVVEYVGDLISIPEAKKRDEKYSKDPTKGCYIKSNGNCHTKVVDGGSRPYLILAASRDISVDEELLYDYGDRSQASLESHPWLKVDTPPVTNVLFPSAVRTANSPGALSIAFRSTGLRTGVPSILNKTPPGIITLPSPAPGVRGISDNDKLLPTRASIATGLANGNMTTLISSIGPMTPGETSTTFVVGRNVPVESDACMTKRRISGIALPKNIPAAFEVFSVGVPGWSLMVSFIPERTVPSGSLTVPLYSTFGR
ncbi:KMT5A-like protein [Mya arenaria]|uniref:KMT5A-like protein n=1 Tax=Mya arenaria TaxID=6604 RepID=A0ABY7DYM9_MYAAR|nr:KMT5A-like protein [Mya arenaria]